MLSELSLGERCVFSYRRICGENRYRRKAFPKHIQKLLYTVSVGSAWRERSRPLCALFSFGLREMMFGFQEATLQPRGPTVAPLKQEPSMAMALRASWVAPTVVDTNPSRSVAKAQFGDRAASALNFNDSRCAPARFLRLYYVKGVFD